MFYSACSLIMCFSQGLSKGQQSPNPEPGKKDHPPATSMRVAGAEAASSPEGPSLSRILCYLLWQRAFPGYQHPLRPMHCQPQGPQATNVTCQLFYSMHCIIFLMRCKGLTLPGSRVCLGVSEKALARYLCIFLPGLFYQKVMQEESQEAWIQVQCLWTWAKSVQVSGPPAGPP